MQQKPLTSGTVVYLEVQSDLLKGNPLGDPAIRQIGVYLPPEYDESKRYPLLMDLAPYTSSGLAHLNWKNFEENLPSRLNRLIHQGTLPPLVMVFPDCFTRLGGNQYINSPGIGLYADFLLQEVIPLVEKAWSCGGAGNRACFGHSSGGYGALVHGMMYPDIWSAVASHGGDMAFELVYLSRMTQALAELAKHGSSVERFLAHFAQKNRPTPSEINCLMTLAMAATYDPDPTVYLGIRLPVDLKTAETIPERWENWRRHDPLELVKVYGENLKKLKGLYVDCGAQDEYDLQYGARRLHRDLTAQGIPHIYEEFEGGHMGIDFRYDRSLPFLAQALLG